MKSNEKYIFRKNVNEKLKIVFENFSMKRKLDEKLVLTTWCFFSKEFFQNRFSLILLEYILKKKDFGFNYVYFESLAPLSFLAIYKFLYNFSLDCTFLIKLRIISTITIHSYENWKNYLTNSFIWNAILFPKNVDFFFNCAHLQIFLYFMKIKGNQGERGANGLPGIPGNEGPVGPKGHSGEPG